MATDQDIPEDYPKRLWLVAIGIGVALALILSVFLYMSRMSISAISPGSKPVLPPV